VPPVIQSYADDLPRCRHTRGKAQSLRIERFAAGPGLLTGEDVIESNPGIEGFAVTPDRQPGSGLGAVVEEDHDVLLGCAGSR
jgi:hypothetical protein